MPGMHGVLVPNGFLPPMRYLRVMGRSGEMVVDRGGYARWSLRSMMRKSGRNAGAES